MKNKILLSIRFPSSHFSVPPRTPSPHLEQLLGAHSQVLFNILLNIHLLNKVEVKYFGFYYWLNSYHHTTHYQQLFRPHRWYNTNLVIHYMYSLSQSCKKNHNHRLKKLIWNNKFFTVSYISIIALLKFTNNYAITTYCRTYTWWLIIAFKTTFNLARGWTTIV